MVHPRLFIIPAPLNHALALAVVAVAFWKGRWRERLVAVAFVLPLPVHALFPLDRIALPQNLAWCVRSLTDDLVLLAACLIAVRGARRYWVIWTAALALLEVVTDATVLLDPDVTLIAFGSANIIWSWCLAAVVMWASLTNPGARGAGPSMVTRPQ